VQLDVVRNDSQLREAALQLRWVCLYRAECHLTASRFYENVHMWVGMAAAGAAVAAGGTAFAGAATIAGLAAILSALAAGFMTTHKPGEKVASHAQAATAYYRLAEEIKLFFKFRWTFRDETDRSHGSDEDLEAPESPAGRAEQPELAALVGFERQEDELETQSPAVPVRLCRLTEEWISAHEQWYPPDQEFTAWQKRRVTAQPRKPRWWAVWRRGFSRSRPGSGELDEWGSR
jgi:hypothetical protein